MSSYFLDYVLFTIGPRGQKYFWSWMIKVVSMDSSVPPDSNDVKMLHNMFLYKKNTSSQGIKLNIG